MTVAEILKSIKEKIVILLENIEDANEMKKTRTTEEEKFPWNIAKKELKLGERRMYQIELRRAAYKDLQDIPASYGDNSCN